MQPEQVIHTILDSEKNAFTNHVNEVLQEDPDVKNKIPIPTGEIFDAVQDGVILW
jgi:plastin-1